MKDHLNWYRIVDLVVVPDLQKMLCNNGTNVRRYMVKEVLFLCLGVREQMGALEHFGWVEKGQLKKGEPPIIDKVNLLLKLCLSYQRSISTAQLFAWVTSIFACLGSRFVLSKTTMAQGNLPRHRSAASNSQSSFDKGDVYVNDRRCLCCTPAEEDAVVWQASFIGAALSRAEQAAMEIAQSGAIRLSPHPDLETEDAFLKMVRNVMEDYADAL